MNNREETILKWLMDDESWSHWAQGLGKQTARDVVLEGLREIRKNPKEAEKLNLRCKSISMEEQESSGADPKKLFYGMEIQLPAADWTETCQRVGTPGGHPVRSRQLLAAVILESKSWKQSGTDTTEFSAGWTEDSLISSIASSTELTHTRKTSLGNQEKVLAWILTAATVASAVAALQ